MSDSLDLYVASDFDVFGRGKVEKDFLITLIDSSVKLPFLQTFLSEILVSYPDFTL